MKHLFSVMATASLLGWVVFFLTREVPLAEQEDIAEEWACHVEQMDEVKKEPETAVDATPKVWPFHPREPFPATSSFAETPPETRYIAVSPDGKKAICVNGEGMPEVWDLATGKKIPWPEKIEKRQFGPVRVAAFTKPGEFVTGDENGSVRLWEVASGKEIRAFKGHTEPVYWLSVSQDGERLLSGDEDGKIRLWAVATGKMLQEVEGSTESPRPALLSPNGRRIIVGRSEDNVLQVIDADCGRKLARLVGHRDRVLALGFAADGKKAISSDVEGMVKIWDIEKGGAVRSIQIAETIEGQSVSVVVGAVAFSPTGRYALVGNGGKHGLRCFEVASGKEVLTFEKNPAAVRAIRLIPGGRQALTLSRWGLVIQWDLTSGDEVRTLRGTRSRKPPIWDVAFSPDGRLALCAGKPDRKTSLSEWQRGGRASVERGYLPATVTIWEVATGKIVTVVNIKMTRFFKARFLQNGKHIWAVARGPHPLYSLEVQSGRLLESPKIAQRQVTSFAFSADGSRALVGGDEMVLWDVGKAKVLRIFPATGYFRGPLGFSADGKKVFSEGTDAFRVWSTETGSCTETWPHKGKVTISEDGKTAFSADLALWRTETGKVQQILDWKGSQISAVAISPKGTKVAAGSQDGYTRIWDLKTGHMDWEFAGKGVLEEVLALDFSPDGQMLLIGTRSGRLNLINVANGHEVGGLPPEMDW